MPDKANISFPESEVERFKSWINSLDDKKKNECRLIVTGTTFTIARRAQMFLSSSLKNPTSYLRGSITPAMSSDRLSGRVFTHRTYGAYVEFGTGTGVIAPSDVAEYAMTFKGKGIRKVNLRARPYLFPAYRLGITEMKTKLEAIGFKEK
jgi:hypothetical protein